MKKSIIAIGVVAVLGIGYVGIAWYTGNVIEENIQSKLTQITNNLNNNKKDFKIAINYSNYQKNIFSTKLHLTVNVTNKNKANITVFNDDITIQHGPFPIAALSHGQFAPQMAWIDYTMTQAASPELWQWSGNQPLIQASLGVNYSEQAKLNLSNNAIKIDANSPNKPSNLDYFELSPGKLTISSNQNFSSGSFSIELNKIAISAQQERIDFDNLKSKGSFQKNQQYENQISFDNMTYLNSSQKYNLPVNFNLIIKNLYLSQHSVYNQDNKIIDGQLSGNMDAFILGKQHLGSIDVVLSFNGLPESILEINNIMDGKQNDYQSSTSFKLNKLIWKNSAGQVYVNSEIKLSGDNFGINQLGLKNIDILKLQLEVPFDVLAQYSTQIHAIEATTVDIEKFNDAKTNITMMAKASLSRKSFVSFNKGETNGIYVDIDYSKENKDVKANGKTISKDDFLNNL